MINAGEIQNKAHKAKVRDQQIEKDYILSWILIGVAHHEKLAEMLVFKGGTVLKKLYFEDYRFSEDLDFTLMNSNISNDQIFHWFAESFEYVLEEANIPLEIIADNEHQDGGINFYISYMGPLGGQGKNKQVKVDISKNEKLAFKAIEQEASIFYSDLLPHKLLCYSLEEILVEKLRSVMQRMQPRDLYDIWYLLAVQEIDISFYTNEFKMKCIAKEINPTDFHQKFEQRIPQYKGRWQNSLSDQIHELPEFDKVIREVKRLLKNFIL